MADKVRIGRVLVGRAPQTLIVGGVDVSKDMALGADFFQLAPGYASLAFEGCSAFDVWFYERWT